MGDTHSLQLLSVNNTANLPLNTLFKVKNSGSYTIYQDREGGLYEAYSILTAASKSL